MGEGAFKTVYKAYDQQEGFEVAWNQVSIAGLKKAERQRVVGEVKTLANIEHKHVISFYGSWFVKEEQKVVFITEIVTSGDLRRFVFPLRNGFRFTLFALQLHKSSERVSLESDKEVVSPDS